MKRIAHLVILSLTVVMASPVIASAQKSGPIQARIPSPTPNKQVPELDASAAGAALALLAGGALLIHARRRRLAR